MIPRVVTSRRTAGWARKTVSAFERGRQERPLRMFIDDASLSPNDLATSMIQGFVDHPLLEVSTTAPTADPHLEVEKADGPYRNDVAKVFTIGTKKKGTGFVRRASQKAQLAARYATQATDLGELTRRILLADYAELHGADAFVTSSAELKAMAKDGPYAGANIMSPEEAVALVGLFLRLRHDFAYLHSGESSASYGKEGFYGLLAKDLLPASGRWLTVCPDGDPLQSSSFKLAWSVLIRVERALYARDHIHEQLLLPNTYELDDGALFYLDAFLYSLAGAFDAIGRVVHATCCMDHSPRRANWREKKKKENWTDELAVKAPAIAQLMEPGKPHRDALELVFLLRNLVHAEGLSSVTVIRDAYRRDARDHRLLLPPEDTGDLLGAFERLGGIAAWGLEKISTAVYLMDIATYVEGILPRVLTAMGEIMTLTPVETLPGATPLAPEGELDADAAMAVPRLRLLSGLG